LLKLEIAKEMAIPVKKNSIKPTYEYLDKLTPEKFNKEVGTATKNYLNDLKNEYYVKMENQASSKREKIVNKINREQKHGMEILINAHENANLKDLMTNRQVVDKMLEIDGKLIQKIDPIYLDPEPNGIIRAHFFAPRKPLAGNYYATYWVNSFVIWGMSLLMAVTLYFDMLKKLLDRLGKLFSVIKRKKHRA
jgi:hypothetical protein